MTTPTVAEPVAGSNTLTALLEPFQNAVVYVKNTQLGPTVFTSDASRSDGHIVWQGVGDPDGQDVQVVPRELLQNVQFQGSLRRGIFEIVEDPAIVEERMAAQQQAWHAQEDRRQHVDPDAIFTEGDKQASVVIERANLNDLVVLDCLQKPQGCDQRVSASLRDIGAKPPLCKAHQGLANKYIATEDQTAPLVDGKAPIKWVRPQVG
jgi:hypothetical protein